MDAAIDHAQYIGAILKQLVASYGLFGIMVALFIIGKIKKFAKFLLWIILVIGIIALVYGGYLTFDFIL